VTDKPAGGLAKPAATATAVSGCASRWQRRREPRSPDKTTGPIALPEVATPLFLGALGEVLGKQPHPNVSTLVRKIPATWRKTTSMAREVQAFKEAHITNEPGKVVHTSVFQICVMSRLLP